METETIEAERVSYNPGAILAGLVIAGLMLALPAPEGLTPEGWRLAALVTLMAIWWVTEAIPVYATGLVPLVGFPLLGIAPVAAAAAPYANPIIFLFLGGFLIAAAMQATGLHQRIALHVLARTGTGARQLVGGFMLTAAFLSMWVSNTATAVMMVPIAMSVIAITVADDGRHAPRGGLDVALLLAVAYGASIGGIATLIGTPPNAFLAGYMAQEHGLEIGFAQWMLFALPLSLVMLGCCWLTLTRLAFRLDPKQIEGVAATLGRALDDLGPIRRPEKTVAAVFFCAAAAWIAQPLIATVVPDLSDTVIAMLAALALFIIPAGGGKPALNWDHASRVPYGLLLLFGGGPESCRRFRLDGPRALACWRPRRGGGPARDPGHSADRRRDRLPDRAHQQHRDDRGDGAAACRRRHRCRRASAAALRAGGAGRQLRLHAAGRDAAQRRRLRRRPCHDPANGESRYLAQHVRHYRRDADGLCAAGAGLPAAGLRIISTPRGRRCARPRADCARARRRSTHPP